MDLRDPATLQSLSSSVITSSAPRPLKNLYKGEPMALGITQILIGILGIAFGLAIVLSKEDVDYHIMIPYWTGILYIISGSLSVAAAKNPKPSLVKGMLGTNVVSAVAGGVGIVIHSISLGHVYHYYHSCTDSYNNDIPVEICQEYMDIPRAVTENISAVLLAFTILEFFIAITSSAFGCASLCRNSYSETTVVIFQNTGQGGPPAVPAPAKVDQEP